jgi:hypothetical protein
MLRTNVGFGIALSVGMVLGYFAEPDADVLRAQAQKSYSFIVTPVDSGQVRLTWPTGTKDITIDGAAINILLTKNDLRIKSDTISQTGADSLWVKVPTQ